MEKVNYPLVSVAIVTYNQKEFLRECIDSVLQQEYQNYEIVVADDASTDGTRELLLEYKEKHNDRIILVLSDVNEGVTTNSNRAYFACKGKYVAMMAGDDLMLPGKIRKQVEYLENHLECTVIYHHAEVFGDKESHILFATHKGDIRTMIKFAPNLNSSAMVRREFAPKNGYNKCLFVVSDYLFWVESLMAGGEIHYLDEVLGKYRKHSKNVSGDSHLNKTINYLELLNSSMIILLKRPKFRKEIFYHISEVLYSIGRARLHTEYQEILKASLFFKFNIKTILLLFWNACFKKNLPAFGEIVQSGLKKKR